MTEQQNVEEWILGMDTPRVFQYDLPFFQLLIVSITAPPTTQKNRHLSSLEQTEDKMYCIYP